MLSALQPAHVATRAAERRRHQRMKVMLLGRYMLPNRMEYPCQTVDISPGGLNLVAPAKAAPGDRVIVYLEHLGRIEGIAVRTTMEGFAMTITATSRKREKFTAQLTWLANREELGLPEDRRHERIVPRNPRTILTFDDGSERVVRIIDISLSGAAFSSDENWPMNTSVRIGATPARIVRRFDGGSVVLSRLSLRRERADPRDGRNQNDEDVAISPHADHPVLASLPV